jgi:hypothetical protein
MIKTFQPARWLTLICHVIDMRLSCTGFRIHSISPTATEPKMHSEKQQPLQPGFQKSRCEEVQWLEQVRLKILRCTAQAMASSPGGLRFVAGTRPWLEGLTGGLQRQPQSPQS